MTQRAPLFSELDKFLAAWHLGATQRYTDGGVAIAVEGGRIISLRPRGAPSARQPGWWLETRLVRLSRHPDRRAQQIAHSAAYSVQLIAHTKAALTIDARGVGLWLRQCVDAPADCAQIEDGFASFCDALSGWHPQPVQSGFAPILGSGALWA